MKSTSVRCQPAFGVNQPKRVAKTLFFKCFFLLSDKKSQKSKNQQKGWKLQKKIWPAFGATHHPKAGWNAQQLIAHQRWYNCKINSNQNPRKMYFMNTGQLWIAGKTYRSEYQISLSNHYKIVPIQCSEGKQLKNINVWQPRVLKPDPSLLATI